MLMNSNRYRSISKACARLRRAFVCLLILFLLSVACFDLKAQSTVKKDSVVLLLSDIGVQLQCTQALNDLYNFKFAEAEVTFNSLKTGYGWHPLPYFLIGLSEWWKIMPNTKDTSHDKKFLAY